MPAIGGGKADIEALMSANATRMTFFGSISKLNALSNWMREKVFDE